MMKKLQLTEHVVFTGLPAIYAVSQLLMMFP